MFCKKGCDADSDSWEDCKHFFLITQVHHEICLLITTLMSSHYTTLQKIIVSYIVYIYVHEVSPLSQVLILQVNELV